MKVAKKENEGMIHMRSTCLTSLLEADARVTELIIDNLKDQEVLLEL